MSKLDDVVRKQTLCDEFYLAFPDKEIVSVCVHGRIFAAFC